MHGYGMVKPVLREITVAVMYVVNWCSSCGGTVVPQCVIVAHGGAGLRPKRRSSRAR